VMRDEFFEAISSALELTLKSELTPPESGLRIEFYGITGKKTKLAITSQARSMFSSIYGGVL
jgi:hypothetical protein